MSARLPEGVVFPDRPTWPVELRCGHVVLRPLRRADRARWHQVRERNRGWTGPWDATMPPAASLPVGVGRQPAGPGDFAQMVRRLNRQAREGASLPFAICVDEQAGTGRQRASRLPVGGQLTVGNIVYGSARFASIGYWIDESLAGHGVVPTAVALATDYCFQVLGLHRIEVNIRPENTKSLRVVQKLGLRDEGLRPRYLHIDGDWRDHRSFSVLDEDVPEGLLNRYLASRTNDQSGAR